MSMFAGMQPPLPSPLPTLALTLSSTSLPPILPYKLATALTRSLPPGSNQFHPTLLLHQQHPGLVAALHPSSKNPLPLPDPPYMYTLLTLPLLPTQLLLLLQQRPAALIAFAGLRCVIASSLRLRGWGGALWRSCSENCLRATLHLICHVPALLYQK